MAKELSFEKQMSRLDEIVTQLEKEDIELDKSIALYEEGLKLSKSLKEQLSKFEEKVNKINEEVNE